MANSLKTNGPHTITAQWRLPAALVVGDLNNVRVNQLNLVDDVLRNDSQGVTLIYAPKTAKTATIKRLFATPSSTVANVPIAQWINNTVYIYGNHSIAGITIIETLNLYNDLRVKGPVNGFHWQADQLLLCDQKQYIAGSLLVKNALPEQQRILSSNIEELWVDSINGLGVNELLVNKAHNRPNLHVASQLIFTQPLTVANYELGDVSAGSNKWKRGVDALDNWQHLNEQVAAVQQRLTCKAQLYITKLEDIIYEFLSTAPSFVLDRFSLLQQLPLNVSRLTLMQEPSTKTEVLAIWHKQQDLEQFAAYAWQPQKQQFIYNSSKWAI